MHIRDFVGRLKNPRATGKGFRARCPAHDDENPSLSISVGGKGQILLKCHLGCTPEAIVAAMGLSMRDLFLDAPSVFDPRKAFDKKIIDVYRYTDEYGLLKYENVRFEPKDFRWRRPDSNGTYVYSLDGVERVPYRLPELIAAMQTAEREIWFTEGEKDADNLRRLGFVATSFKNWTAGLNRHIVGVNAILFVDHDRPGVKQADDAARICSQAARSLKIVDLFADLPLADKHGPDVSDWIGARQKDGFEDTEIAEELARIAEAVPFWDGEKAHGGGLNSLISPNSHSERAQNRILDDTKFNEEGVNSPNSLISHPERRKKPTLDEAAYHGLAGEVIRKISPHTEASSVAMLIQLLSGFGAMIGRNAWFQIGRTRHYFKVNVVLVGPSGVGRKGTSWDEVRNLLARADEGFGKIVVSGLSSGEGLINHVKDPVYKKTAIKEKGRIVDYQDELAEEGASEKRLIVVEPEFSRVLKAAGRDGSILSEVLRDIYDRDELRVMTKNKLQATGVHVSFIGHITEFELLRELDDTSKANGFANRILWVYTERERLLPFGGEIPAGQLNEAIVELQAAYRYAETAGELTRTPAADTRWAEIYQRLDGVYDGLADSLISRASTNVMRIACIYALLDRSSDIDVVHLNAALAVWRYCEDTVRYLFGTRLGDKVADTILDALKDGPLSRTDVSTLLGRHAKAETISAAVGRLERMGRITCERATDTGGPPMTIYRLKNCEIGESSELSPGARDMRDIFELRHCTAPETRSPSERSMAEKGRDAPMSPTGRPCTQAAVATEAEAED